MVIWFPYQISSQLIHGKKKITYEYGENSSSQSFAAEITERYMVFTDFYP